MINSHGERDEDGKSFWEIRSEERRFDLFGFSVATRFYSHAPSLYVGVPKLLPRDTQPVWQCTCTRELPKASKLSY